VRKRAATIVVPGRYCNATTDASVSSEPSALRNRNTSANSRGVVQANRTSRGVPNSMTVFSGSSKAPGWPSFVTLLRMSCTGIRTGVASGKKRAKSATMLAFLTRAFADPSCPKDYAPVQLRVGLPLFPVRKSVGEPKHAVMQPHRSTSGTIE
jgi:hypothetical protein